IGLAFTKELVEMHRGELKVESTVGVGSTFSFSIPHHPNEYSGTFDEGLPVLEASEKLSPETTLKAHLDSDLPLILVVEDNADVRQYVHSVLADSYELAFAVNGQEGIEQALKIIPDLIVSDVMMPLVSGFELCAAVKTNILTAHIPLILLTAKSSSESRIKGLETEADIYMAKPFNPTELSLQIRNLLSLKERLREKYQKDRGLVIPLSVQGNSMEQKFLDRLEKIMASNFENPEFNAEMMCGAMDMSRSHLHRKLKALTNDSTTRFIRTYRLKIAYQKLQLGTDSISAIAYDVGFNNVSYFNKCFKEAFGKQPSEITV
ncbi:MAG: response regulator, partial [Flavobacteriales bacterium]|nr:response regulator [Flavobacteriales bacterium]